MAEFEGAVAKERDDHATGPAAAPTMNTSARPITARRSSARPIAPGTVDAALPLQHVPQAQFVDGSAGAHIQRSALAGHATAHASAGPAVGPAARIRRSDVGMPVVRRKLQTAGADTTATDVLQIAQAIEGFDVWKRTGDLGNFEDVDPVIDLQHGGGGWTVTIDAVAAVGSPFATIGAAIDALEAQVFVSLEADAESGLYDVAVAVSDKIRKASGEGPFEDYSDGTSVDDAVEQAIAGLDMTGSNSARYARHDFQPAQGETKNLQVQLGGSHGNYRFGQGDTSSTLVVIDGEVWRQLRESNAARLRQLVQSAHRRSFTERVRIDITPKQ